MGKHLPVTAAQLEALRAFKRCYGRSWKRELIEVFWYNARIFNGSNSPEGAILHGLRNSHGNAWLRNFRGV